MSALPGHLRRVGLMAAVTGALLAAGGCSSGTPGKTPGQTPSATAGSVCCRSFRVSVAASLLESVCVM